ncbi:MAG: hypothetical protein DRP42_01695 [Tenericutes bacterium]|nr:MAG: hypothetical protein DRP42_01695 [Mycoplasmatota bacterium]
MFLTGTSKKSRNFSTGFKIGKANKVTKTILSQFSTVEGLKSIEVINSIAEKNNIDMPLFNLLYNLTYKRKEPKQTVERFFRKGK